MKEIIVGEVAETIWGTPIYLFEEAIRLSKEENFSIRTNNPQFIETLEVLVGEENMDIYIKLSGELNKVNFHTAYNYLGDLYHVINSIRFRSDLGSKKISDEWLEKQIRKYNKRYKNGEIDVKEFEIY